MMRHNNVDIFIQYSFIVWLFVVVVKQRLMSVVAFPVSLSNQFLIAFERSSCENPENYIFSSLFVEFSESNLILGLN